MDANIKADVELKSSGTKPQLLVWWIPQIPMQQFRVKVDSFAVAKALLATLAEYDKFQLANNIKTEYSNVGGLMMLEHGEYLDWADENGDEIGDLTYQQCVDMDWEGT